MDSQLLDCNLDNFIITADGKYSYIDIESKAKFPLDMSFCLYRMLYNINKDLYKYFINFYKLEDKYKYYNDLHMLIKKESEILNQTYMFGPNKDLIDKYIKNVT